MSQYIDARIVEKNDPPPFPELLDKGVEKVEMDKFVVIQGGMTSGKASIGFFGTAPDGRVVFMECGAAVFDHLYGIAKGARLRWGEEIS